MIMERAPEPELMQDLLQVKAYAQEDFSTGDDSLICRVEEYLLKKGKVLDSRSLIVDLGCGPGNITTRLGLRWPSVKVIGVDGSEAMLAIARSRKVEKMPNNSFENISYLCCDISLIADGSISLKENVDLIVSNSFLHHLHDPSKFWRTLKALSTKGTFHLHRDLRRPSSLDEAIALQKIYLPDSPEVLTREELASLQAAFTVSELKAQLNSQGLGHLSVLELGDRYLEIVGTF